MQSNFHFLICLLEIIMSDFLSLMRAKRFILTFARIMIIEKWILLMFGQELILVAR